MIWRKKQSKPASTPDLSDSNNDLTDRFLPDPFYHPLSPSHEDLATYIEELEYEGNQITIEWATYEILTHRMGWVRVGLVADKVRRYRLYKGKFPDWKTWCLEVLGKANWQVNKMIEASLAVAGLIKEEFSVIPTCMAHVQALLTCCKKSGMLLRDAWIKVNQELPKQFLITANNIFEVLGFPVEEKRKLNIPKHLRDRLERRAFDDGLTIEEKINELLDMEEGIDPNEEEPTEEEQELKEQLWRDDMQKLIQEHDREIWLITALSKLINQGKRKISQFGYLREYEPTTS